MKQQKELRQTGVLKHQRSRKNQKPKGRGGGKQKETEWGDVRGGKWGSEGSSLLSDSFLQAGVKGPCNGSHSVTTSEFFYYLPAVPSAGS